MPIIIKRFVALVLLPCVLTFEGPGVSSVAQGHPFFAQTFPATEAMAPRTLLPPYGLDDGTLFRTCILIHPSFQFIRSGRRSILDVPPAFRYFIKTHSLHQSFYVLWELRHQLPELTVRTMDTELSLAVAMLMRRMPTLYDASNAMTQKAAIVIWKAVSRLVLADERTVPFVLASIGYLTLDPEDKEGLWINERYAAAATADEVAGDILSRAAHAFMDMALEGMYDPFSKKMLARAISDKLVLLFLDSLAFLRSPADRHSLRIASVQEGKRTPSAILPSWSVVREEGLKRGIQEQHKIITEAELHHSIHRHMITGTLRAEAEPAVLEAAASIREPEDSLPDMTELPWTTIDGDSAMDFEQAVYVESTGNGWRLLLSIIDLTHAVPKDSPVDLNARQNGGTVYPGVRAFTMLPDHPDLRHLNFEEGAKRRGIVADMIISAEGKLVHSTVYPAWVQNHARLTYDAVFDRLTGSLGSTRKEASLKAMATMASSPDIQKQIRLQHTMALALRERRIAEDFVVVYDEDEGAPAERMPGQRGREKRSLASSIVEEEMIVLREVFCRFLKEKGSWRMDRVLKPPQKWKEIVQLAASYGVSLPAQPSDSELRTFIRTVRLQHVSDYRRVMKTLIRLIGFMEYVVIPPAGRVPHPYELRVLQISSGSAPKRRYADLITQRLLWAAWAGAPCPYTEKELETLARHLTWQDHHIWATERAIQRMLMILGFVRHIGKLASEGMVVVSEAGKKQIRLLTGHLHGVWDLNPAGLDVAGGDRINVVLDGVDPYALSMTFKATRLLSRAG